MAEKSSVDLQSIEIVPLAEKKMLKGAFLIEEPAHVNLINWIKTAAFMSQREKKSKTYLVFLDGRAVAYITVSMGLIEEEALGLEGNTSFNPQVLVVGKFYVVPELRGAGIGTKVLSFVLDIATNLDEMLGCIGIILDANNNKETLEFYRRFGFVEISQDAEERTVKMFFKLPTSEG